MSILSTGIFLLMISTLFLNPYEVRCGPHQRKLLKDLLSDYNTLERPVANESSALNLTLGLTLLQILNVDESKHYLETNAWLKMQWTDENLRWNESDYGGINDIRIPPSRIWKPDVCLYNSADEDFDRTYPTNVVVSSDGGLLYIPPAIFKSTCKFDLTWFPFDDQKCKLKFGSWTYSGFKIDLQLESEKADLSNFVRNGEWELIDVSAERHEVYYQCCPEPYIDITYSVELRRRTTYYFYQIILPAFLISSMAMLCFILPPESNQKLTLGVTVLLLLTVFTSLVNSSIPATSDSVPLLGVYFNCILFMQALSVVATVFVLNYHHRTASTHVISPLMRRVFLLWLPRLLWINLPGEKNTRKNIQMNKGMNELELKETGSQSLLENVQKISHNNDNTTASYVQNGKHSADDFRLQDHTGMSASTGDLNHILKEVRVITHNMIQEKEESEVTNDWRCIAMVMDRLFLIVFTCFNIAVLAAVLISAPHIRVD